MACNDVISNGITDEPLFDFEEWVKDHTLFDIKDLMVKHNLNRIDTLSLASPEYIAFSMELLQTKPHFIPKIINAIQVLDSQTSHEKAPSHSLKDFIVISEAEQYVVDILNQHTFESNSITNSIKELKIQYPKSIQRIKEERDTQIKATQQKITDIFDNVQDEINKRKEYLLNELYKIKEGDNDDIKQTDIFNELDNVMKIQTQKINDNLQLCEEIITTYKNQNKQKRKEIVLNIGKEHKNEYNIAIQNIQKSEQIVREIISKNNAYNVRIDSS